MISLTLVALTLATIFLARFLLNKYSWKNSPPGPKRVPIFGNALQLEKGRYQNFVRWAKEFGPIYRMDMLGKRFVVVSDHKLLKEMFSQAACSGRPDLRILDAVGDGNMHGIIFSDGPHWEELRRFTLRNLRDFGFGKQSLEDSIMIEVNDFLDGLKKDSDKPIRDLSERLLFSVVNSLWAIVNGQRFNSGDDTLLNLTKKQQEIAHAQLESGLLIFFPILGKLFPGLSGYNKTRGIMNEVVTVVTEPIKGHKTTHDPQFNRDFTDVFLSEMKKSTDTKSAFFGELGNKNLTGVTHDLYAAGTDTSSTALTWMILYLSKMPEVQRKFQAEIEAVTGNTRQVQLSDRPQMPYTEALISEALRYSSFNPQGFFHRTVEDTKVNGYNIPKDTIIIPNVYYIHFDPKIWGDPENFRPERFLSPDGTKFKKAEALIPFSVGRRQCLGESLARDTLFLFSTNLFQKFLVDFDKNGPDHGFEPIESFLLEPHPFHLHLKERV